MERGDGRGSVKASGERSNEERDKKWLHRNMDFYKTREAASVPPSVQNRLSANSLITDNSNSQMKSWKKGRGCWEDPPNPTPPIPDPAPELRPRNCSRPPAGYLRRRQTSHTLLCALSYLPGVLLPSWSPPELLQSALFIKSGSVKSVSFSLLLQQRNPVTGDLILTRQNPHFFKKH